jgi:hypothetical protein
MWIRQVSCLFFLLSVLQNGDDREIIICDHVHWSQQGVIWWICTVVKEFERGMCFVQRIGQRAHLPKQIRTEIDSFEQNTQQCWCICAWLGLALLCCMKSLPSK